YVIFLIEWHFFSFYNATVSITSESVPWKKHNTKTQCFDIKTTLSNFCMIQLFGIQVHNKGTLLFLTTIIKSNKNKTTLTHSTSVISKNIRGIGG
ncbi:hypothetical protein ACJX0J_031572, partial [Zea mays]